MLLIEAGNQRALAAARLARLVGADLERRMAADASLEEPGVPPSSLTLLMDEARNARGERRAIRFRIDAADEQRVAAALSMRPTVAIAGGIDMARTESTHLPARGSLGRSWDASVNVNWPLWDGDGTRPTWSAPPCAPRPNASGLRSSTRSSRSRSAATS